MTLSIGKGLDVGTSNLVAAKETPAGVEIKRLRNAFVEIEDEQRERLSLGSLNAVHIKNSSYIVGDEAISIARVLNKQVRRPMASGVLNPEEKEARPVLQAFIQTLLGDPAVPGEFCAFSVPAAPVDSARTNNIWHQGFFSSLLEGFGYEPQAVNEALAIIYDECAKEEYSGIAISHGAGQVNVCASYKLVGSLEFSIARSGDWIDNESSKATGIPIPRILRVKEDPTFDLMNYEAIDEEIGGALFFHYKSLIKYELTHLVGQWSKMKNQLDFPDAIPVILSGGTAAIKGFKELWEKELQAFQKKAPLPFKISEVRMAKDPFGSVARGLLAYATAQGE